MFELDPRTHKRRKKVEKSERPASVFSLPASHEITVASPLGTFDSVPGDVALVMYLLAFVYGTRLQLAEWRFEGRVPVKPVNNIYVTDDICLDFLEHTYGWWRGLSEDQRSRFINVLYVYTRARSLEWEWDAFIYQYMTFDALYRLYADLHPSTQHNSIGHRQRFRVLLGAYDMPIDNSLIDQIYMARNQLFHEALWTDSTIGFGSSDTGAFYLPYHLARLNDRIICNLIGYRNEYAGSVWWAMGTFLFDKCK